MAYDEDYLSDGDEPPQLVESGDIHSDNNDFVPNGDSSVPITILAGFLGSGKSTLLHHILTSTQHRKRICVIQNELGDTMDVEDLVARDANDGSILAGRLYELRNGCVCCTIKDSLAVTLEALLEERHLYQHIVIELTGLADPGPVASRLWLDDAMHSRLKLDGIVTLVDAKNITRQLEGKEGKEAVSQIACADRIIINKSDLLSNANEDEGPLLDELEHKLKTINSIAPLLRTTRSAVPLKFVLGIQAFDALQMNDDDKQQQRQWSSNDGGTAAKSALGVTTLSITCSIAVNLEKVEKWIAALLWDLQAAAAVLEEEERTGRTVNGGDKSQSLEIYRMKGVLNLGGQAMRHVVQGVYDTFEILPSRPWQNTDFRQSKLVFIGRGLTEKKEDLTKGLMSCCSVSSIPDP
eukprot:74741_1